MRCYCCNKALNDYESTNKDLYGQYLDTCNKCLKGLQIPTLGRPDLEPDGEAPDGDDDLIPYEEEIDDDYDWWEE